MGSGASIAVDIGGTFTDIVLHRGSEVFVDKTLTTHGDLLSGFFRGMEAVLARAGAKPGDVDGVLVHATTIVTNALIERSGERTAMIFTEGFSDILRIRDERRYDVYDPQIEFPKPYVDADSVFTVAERTLSDGSIEKAPMDAEVERLARRLADAGIRSVGICFLHSYKNPANERHVAEVLRRHLPDLYISLSSDVAPQIREYLRASTTSANAYAVPTTQPYLAGLERKLVEEGYPSRPLVMLSSGGVVGPRTAGQLPVRMVESGPAAGALGAAFIARAMSLPNLLAFDMGGTTAKVCLIQEYEPLVTGHFEVDRMYRLKEGSGIPLAVPCIDLIEIGAGGGSIAGTDDLGLLKVGPRSAGSKPGPACYGLGGTEPTVTDSDVVLGLLDPNNFLGGDMRLDMAAAQKAVGGLGQTLGLTAVDAARGIFRIVCEAMASAVRAHATERGVDYRGLPLLAFGGAGPVHACGVAEMLNSRMVIFPPLASVLSAFGSLVTPVRLDLVRSSLSRLDALDWQSIETLYGELEEEGRKALVQSGTASKDVSFLYGADMRYLGQQYELLIHFPERPTAENFKNLLRKAFEDAYRIRYSLTQDDVPVEIVTWRLAAIGPKATPPALDRMKASGRAARSRPVHLWQENQSVAVISRADLLQQGKSVAGPLVIEERETTLVIPPGWVAAPGQHGCVIATRPEKH
ncbi:hydantoinase/oxoprolinase family protein [Ferrovibrio sp.]|uniref:hydantoinase/oxoprolinase family protein n=1 Tax=Ferrovibrio sp. TaxID=1917215 RepID=UPI0035AFD94D